MEILDQMASGGRQHRFNTPAWNSDFVSPPSWHIMLHSENRVKVDNVRDSQTGTDLETRTLQPAPSSLLVRPRSRSPEVTRTEHRQSSRGIIEGQMKCIYIQRKAKNKIGSHDLLCLMS